MQKDKEMTLDEHMETADDLAIATHHLNKIFLDTKSIIRSHKGS